MLPGLGTVHDLKNAHEAGASVARIATHCTEADVSIQHFGAARALGMETVGFLMLSHKAVAGGARRAGPDHGGRRAPSASTSSTPRARWCSPTRRSGSQAVIDEIGAEAQVGFHGHQNLSLGVANSVLAYQAGAPQIDGALCALGAGAGNSPTEVLAATFERMGIRTGVDLGEVLVGRRGRRAPVHPAPAVDGPRVDHPGLRRRLLARSCCTPSGPPSATACRPTRSCSKVGEYGYVGGQEDMIIDIALQLAEEKSHLVELGDLAGMGVR